MTARASLTLLAELRAAGMTPATMQKPQRVPATELFLHGGAWAGSIVRVDNLPQPIKNLPRAVHREKGLMDYGALNFDLRINLDGARRLLESHERGTSISALVGFSDGTALPRIGKNKRLLRDQPEGRTWVLMRGHVKTAEFRLGKGKLMLCRTVFVLKQPAEFRWKQP